MADVEPAILREAGGDDDVSRSRPEMPKSAPARTAADRKPAQVVHVVGFWKRAAAAFVDLLDVIPTAMLVTFLVGKISGVRLPSEKLHLLDIDLWIDLVLATDPA